jgi:hypothetical protein
VRVGGPGSLTRKESDAKVVFAALLLLVLAAALLVVPGMVLAGGPTLPSNPPPPPAHRHFLVEPDGSLVPVGPDWCDNRNDPAIALAFYHFHWNVHKGADGLVNGLGGEITSRSC